jgi:hypothetical protein
MRDRKKYMASRRAKLRVEGICVDCQKEKAHINAKTGQRHVLCVACLAARRSRIELSAKRQYTLPMEVRQ